MPKTQINDTVLTLEGNTFRKIALPYTITAETVLEFDYTSAAAGEIQGIGIDSDNTASPSSFFQLSGTSVWGKPDIQKLYGWNRLGQLQHLPERFIRHVGLSRLR